MANAYVPDENNTIINDRTHTCLANIPNPNGTKEKWTLGGRVYFNNLNCPYYSFVCAFNRLDRF